MSASRVGCHLLPGFVVNPSLGCFDGQLSTASQGLRRRPRWWRWAANKTSGCEWFRDKSSRGSNFGARHRILVTAPATSDTSGSARVRQRVVVVQNWFSDLRPRVP